MSKTPNQQVSQTTDESCITERKTKSGHAAQAWQKDTETKQRRDHILKKFFYLKLVDQIYFSTQLKIFNVLFS